MLTRFRPEKQLGFLNEDGSRRLDGEEMSQALTDEFFEDFEPRLQSFGVKNNSIISKTTKTFADSFLGVSLAYDEALYKGDAVMASVLWRFIYFNIRNMFQCKGNIHDIYNVVEYTQKTLHSLDNMETNRIMKGDFQFNSIKEKV